MYRIYSSAKEVDMYCNYNKLEMELFYTVDEQISKQLKIDRLAKLQSNQKQVADYEMRTNSSKAIFLMNESSRQTLVAI